MKKIVYKLTDENGQTLNNTQWGNNISHTAKGNSKKLCSNGFIHYYTNPLLAVLLNPIHADFKSPKLWEAEASGEIINEALKSGCKTLTTIREIPLPEISLVHRDAFGILCAKEVCKDEAWNLWAVKWLSGEDRSENSARAARAAAAAAYACAYDATYACAYDATSNAVHHAVWYASNVAANASNVAANASGCVTRASANAADAAAYAAAYAANKSINFVELAEKAMTFK